MCIACQHDAMWFAYLRRKGLITADGVAVEDPPFLVGIDEPQPSQEEKTEERAGDSANKDQFSCE